MKISGIYKIINKINGKYYVGSSVNIKDYPNNRWSRHIADLNANRHHNDYLQRAWNKYGKDAFEFIIIENYNSKCEKELLLIEQKYLDIALNEKDKCYNECFLAGKVTMTPEIRKKISDSHKGKIVPKGKDNPLYGRKISLEIKMKISESLKGEKNHFYGKTHTEETIKKLKKSAKHGALNHNYDHTVYKFVNIITNEVFEGTRHQFYTKYNFDKKCIRRLIRGIYTQYKKWKLLK